MKSPDKHEAAYLSAIADAIRERRERLDLSIRDAAAIAGMPQSAWWAQENRGNPTSVTLFRIAKALGCTPRDLLPNAEISQMRSQRSHE